LIGTQTELEVYVVTSGKGFPSESVPPGTVVAVTVVDTELSYPCTH